MIKYYNTVKFLNNGSDIIVASSNTDKWIIICLPIMANGPYLHVCCYGHTFVLITLYNGLVYPPFHSEFEISSVNIVSLHRFACIARRGRLQLE